MAINPFTPSFGVTPPLLAGREDQLAAFAEGLEEGVGSPTRAVLFTGARGSGKTVMLNAVEDVARAHGWVVLSETTRPGVAAELASGSIMDLLRDLDPNSSTWRTTGAQASLPGAGVGADGEHVDRYPQSQIGFRAALSRAADLLDERAAGTGVLLSLDEVHKSARDDLRIITQAVQHAFREGRQVAFVAAGLPSSISDVLTDDVMSFLRRAEHFDVGIVDASAVAEALRRPIENGGRRITDEALDLATSATAGYPFLIQSIGHASWAADPGSTVITIDHAQQGIDTARRRMGRLVHAPALRDLSEVDRSFLAAMAVDDGPSSMGAIAKRLGVKSNYAGQYRHRLIEAEMIYPAGHGRVDFTLPYLRDYLREHVASTPYRAGFSSAAFPTPTTPGTRPSLPPQPPQGRQRPDTGLSL
ncbi:ATP-binding protein [Alteromonas gracilis]